MRFHRATVLALALLAACDAGSPAVIDLGSGSRLNLVNAAGSFGPNVSLFVDGNLFASIAAGSLAGGVDIAPGTHTLALSSGTGEGFTRSFQFAQGRTVTVVAYDSAGFLRPSLLSDTNAVVPAGATKLRVAHYATGAPAISIWRTQPDFQTPIRVQFPFPYRAESPYLQSTPGDWRVLVSSEVTAGGNPSMPDTLAGSGLIAVAAGTSRTVVVLDNAGGGMQVVVFDP